MYSFKKDKIIQDDINFEKTTSKKFKKFWQSFKTKADGIKTSIYTKYKEIDWEQAGHNTAFVLLYMWSITKSLIKAMPLLLGVFFLIQLGLGISSFILPFTPWFDWGWNAEFLKTLPYIMQPHGHPWASISISFCTVFLYILMEEKTEESFRIEKLTFFNILFTLIIVAYFYAMFVIPEKVVEYAGICGCVAIVLYLIIVLNEGSGGGGGGGSCSDLSYYGSSDDDSEEETYTYQKQEVDTVEYKFIEVRQNGNFVLMRSAKFVNGSRDNGGFNEFSKTGVLQNWSESQVTILDGKWFRIWNPRNQQVRTWIDIRH